MKSFLIALSLASSVAAQAEAIAFPTDLAINAAINPNDPEYAVCENVIDKLQGCITSIGGTDALETADPNVLVGCACCQTESAISAQFSTCASYLEAEGGLDAATQATALASLYRICSANANCRASGGSSTPRVTSGSSARAPITQGAQMPDACLDLDDAIASCRSKTPDFLDLGYKSQAKCYCCKRGAGGTTTWNDQFDKYASTCADWAQTDMTSIYPLASAFSTLCDQFSDVCGAATSTGHSSSSSSSSSSGSSGFSDSNDASTGISKGAIIGAAVGGAAGFIILLLLVGFLWHRRKRLNQVNALPAVSQTGGNTPYVTESLATNQPYSAPEVPAA